MPRVMTPRLVLLLAAVLLLPVASVPAEASQAAAPFTVRVNLLTDAISPPVENDLCRSSNMPGAFGAEVTVVCATGIVVEIRPSRSGSAGASLHGGAYRFLLPVFSAIVIPNQAIETGLGTVTTWRVIQASDRKYLEMMVQW